VIVNKSLNIYINDEKYGFEMIPSSLNKGEFATISLDLWGISEGEYALRITNPKTEIFTYFEAELPNSCVLALDFDEGEGTIAYDSSSYGNDGTLKNDEGDEWVNGKFGKALETDGLDDNVEVLDSISLDTLAYTKQATWAFWFKFNTLNFPTNTPVILGKNFTDIYKEYNIRFENSSKKIMLVLANGVNSETYFCDKTDWNIGEWYHITIDYINTTQEANFYVNGVLINTEIFTINNLLIDNSASLLIGISTAGAAFNGTIDSVRIYNKALTPDETVKLKLKLG